MSAKRKPSRKRIATTVPTAPVIPPPKNALLDFIRNFFTGASGKTRAMALGVIVCALIVEYPKSVAWLGNDLGTQVFEAAKQFRNIGGATLLLFFKQWNVTGGNKPVT